MDLREIPFWACHAGNYKAGRTAPIQYIVMHYTANNGDRAKANCQYYGGTVVQASAHYFVDEDEIWQSVRDSDTAWHCGAKGYRHPVCRNANSIGVELCSDKVNGQYVITPETVSRAVALVRTLAAKYGIGRACVVRHFDVTGKVCPEPWVRDEGQFAGFLDRVFEEETGLTEARVREILREELAALEAGRAGLPVSGWAAEALERAKDAGITDGLRPRSWATREEVAVMLARAGKL